MREVVEGLSFSADASWSFPASEASTLLIS